MDLTRDLQEAARQLGYEPSSWDGEHLVMSCITISFAFIMQENHCVNIMYEIVNIMILTPYGLRRRSTNSNKPPEPRGNGQEKMG
jgi:hypothetical protein